MQDCINFSPTTSLSASCKFQLQHMSDLAENGRETQGKDNDGVVGGSVRKDGSVRRVVKVRPGYIAPENVPKYVPRAKRTDPNRGALLSRTVVNSDGKGRLLGESATKVSKDESSDCSEDVTDGHRRDGNSKRVESTRDVKRPQKSENCNEKIKNVQVEAKTKNKLSLASSDTEHDQIDEESTVLRDSSDEKRCLSTKNQSVEDLSSKMGNLSMTEKNCHEKVPSHKSAPKYIPPWKRK